jgi:hypothetical protein
VNIVKELRGLPRVSGIWTRIVIHISLPLSYLMKFTNPEATSYALFFNWYWGGWSPIGPLGTAATNRTTVPAPGDYDDGEIDGMMIGKGN